jgi:hypothetical protein
MIGCLVRGNAAHNKTHYLNIIYKRKVMTLLEKIELAIQKGITCNLETGEVFGVRGEAFKKYHKGYNIVSIKHKNKGYTFGAHQFIFYFYNKQVVEQIDHIDTNRSNNAISNLRPLITDEYTTANQKNSFNQHKYRGVKIKGYRKKGNKFQSYIKVNYKFISLGYFETEQEASQAYLEAKKKYHVI